MTTPFTDLEYVELGDAYAAHDEWLVRAVYHVAEERRELETLQEQGRI